MSTSGRGSLGLQKVVAIGWAFPFALFCRAVLSLCFIHQLSGIQEDLDEKLLETAKSWPNDHTLHVQTAVYLAIWDLLDASSFLLSVRPLKGKAEGRKSGT